MEGDTEFERRGPIAGERFLVLDDLTEGEWYAFECVDDDWIYAPFAGFHYNAMAKARGGIWFKVIMAGGRRRLIWSGHAVRVFQR